MNYVAIGKLLVGMILGENIYRNDQLVISSDVVISSRHIDMLKRLNISQVKIKQEKEVNINSLFKIDLKSRYKNSVKKFKEICFSLAIGNVLIYDEIKELIDPLINEISENPKLAMKLWQIEMSDFYTYEHSVKVCMLSVFMSKWLGKSDFYINEIGKSALLHDIGKCNIPNEILNKPDMLTLDEFNVIKTHSTLGFILLSTTKELSSDILNGILHHHERYDGSGYPSQLIGEDIHEYARIISITDVFDAMTSNRVYRQCMNPFKVIEIMEESSGEFDPKLKRIFISHIKEFYIGSKILLQNGETAKIIKSSTISYRPIIEIENKIIDLSINYDIEIKELILDN